MHDSKGARVWLIAALAAAALVGALLFLGREREPERSTPPEPRSDEPPGSSPPRAGVDNSLENSAEAPPPAARLGDTSAAAASAGELADAAPFPAEVREHARLMFQQSVLHAVDEGDVERARWLREQLSDPRIRESIAAPDVEALDLIIDCLEHAPDAREEARDFLQFGATTALGEALQRACE